MTESIVAMSVYKKDSLDWLEEAINSVLSQTYQDFTLVIYKDGYLSSDILTFLHGLKKVFTNLVIVNGIVNQGLGSALHTIIEYFDSDPPEFFIRMDADDWCYPERFAKQISYLKENPNIDVLGTSLVEVDEKGKQVGKRIMNRDHETLVKMLSLYCPLNHPTVVIRFDAFLKFGGYNPKHKNTQDYFLWIKMVGNGAKIANLSEPLLKFRRVNGFYKRRGRGKSINELKARFQAMKMLNQWSILNISYALMVFILRMMPEDVLKFAYKIDRRLIRKETKSL